METLPSAQPQDVIPQPPFETSESPLPQGEAGEQQGFSIKTVAWEHSPQNTQKTVEAVADCAVVAFEHRAFKDAKLRREYDEAATIFVSSTATSEERHKAEKILDKFDSDNPAYAQLLNNLQGTGKRIVTLDMDLSDPNYPTSNKVIKAKYHLHKALSYSSMDEMKATILDNTTAAAKWDVAREARMLQQVDTLAQEYEDTNVKIGVLIGASHTSVHHELSRRYPTERAFVVSSTEGQSQHEKVYFNPYERLRRRITMLPGKPIPEVLVDRAVMSIVDEAADPLFGDRLPRNSHTLEHLSDAEVSELIVALDGVKHGVIARLMPTRRARKMHALIAAKAAEAQKRRQTPDRRLHL
jgi:hypothetical protein